MSLRPARAAQPATLDLLGLPVSDLSADDVVRLATDAAVSRKDKPFILFALHVGGLLVRRRPEFRKSMQRADVTYADGISVVLLARLAGAKHIDRAATTDIGWTILERCTQSLGRRTRIAAIGGQPGLAESALKAFENRGVADGVFATHGYHETWPDVLDAVAAAKPDVVLVGLGAPLEMEWVEANADALPAAVILTCGGWFGHVVGEEPRAPLWLRRAGLEWTYRAYQSPRRLGPRYLKALVIFPALGSAVIARRLTGTSRRVHKKT